jgi:hypothetical protein
MKALQHPAIIGALVIGIAFNILLSLLGLLGYSFWEALYLVATSLIVGSFLGMRWLIRRIGKKAG